MKSRATLIGAVVLAVLVVVPVEARTLRDDLGQASRTVGLAGGSAFNALADTIANTAARSLPVTSASAGYTYRFNPELEIFERTSETLGPIFLERPDTLGRSKFNLNVSFQYVEFNSLDGTSLTNLQSPDPVITRVVGAGGATLGFTANTLQYRLRLQNYITAFSFTYGILDRLDANLLIPLVATDFAVGVTSQQVAIAGPDGAFAPQSGPPVTGRTVSNAYGVGDILMRFKYQLPPADRFRWAAGLQLRVPSGSEDDFRGIGSFEVTPALYASTLLWSRVEPYVNVGINVLTDDVSQSEASYGAGFDVDVTRWLGLTFAFLGRSEFSSSASKSSTSFLHLANGQPTLEPLLGIDFSRNDFFDFSFGLRAVVWRQMMVFVNGIHSLNEAGLRNDTIIPTVGIEQTF